MAQLARALPIEYLDEPELFRDYKIEEPWDGPNNRKLLEKIPDCYADPVYGENSEFFTNYVAITSERINNVDGSGTKFSTAGVKFDGTRRGSVVAAASGVGYRPADTQFNILLVGHVGFDRKIPWLKPEDIEQQRTASRSLERRVAWLFFPAAQQKVASRHLYEPTARHGQFQRTSTTGFCAGCLRPRAAQHNGLGDCSLHRTRRLARIS